MCCSLRVKWPQFFEIHISTPSYIPQTLSKASHFIRNRADKRRIQPRQDRKPTATQHEPLKARETKTLPNWTPKKSEWASSELQTLVGEIQKGFLPLQLQKQE